MQALGPTGVARHIAAGIDFDDVLQKKAWLCGTRLCPIKPGIRGFYGQVGILGTTPFNRDEMAGHLKKRGSFGHPAGRDVPLMARSRSEEANDEPADAILPQPAGPG
jgi:hypothetical protein